MNKLIKIFKLDELGFLVYEHEMVINKGDEIPYGYTDLAIPCNDLGEQLPFYKLRMVEGSWVEGASQEEIDELTINQPIQLTDTEALGQQMTERELEAMIQGQQLSDIEIRLLTLEVK